MFNNDLFKTNVGRTIIFTIIAKRILLGPWVLQQFHKQCCWNICFYNISNNPVVRTIGFTTCLNIMLLEPLVLQHFPTQCCQNHWCYNSFKNNVVRTSGTSKRLILHLTVDNSQNKVVRTIGFTSFLPTRLIFLSFGS